MSVLPIMHDRREKVREFMSTFHTMRRVKGFRPPIIPHITPAQWGVLMILEAGGESSVKDLAAVLHVTSPAATRLIDGLVASGYVVRHESPSDRRKMLVAISKKSVKEIARIKEKSIKKFLASFSVLTDEELDQFISLHKKVAEGMAKNGK